MQIFEVYEVEWPSRKVITPPHGLFTNAKAAEAYLQSCLTPLYERYMVIVKTRALDNWPPNATEYFNENELTYYVQHEGNQFLEFFEL